MKGTPLTTYTKRRRSVAAVLATLLIASLLAVVAGSPAHAANTSGEELIDTDSNGIGDAREFAGSHRYNTAVKLAEHFAEHNGGVTTLIIASGETEVDAVAAAGLAGNLNAAVLLTRSSRLPHNVARFIDEHNVTDVIVVGGTASVSDDVVTMIEGLGSDPDVSRVAGSDRYATAAAIGDRLGGPNPTWCGSDQTAAILVNGTSMGRADAVAIGPLAYALGLPVLLTAADELPQSTEDFLVDNKVERVVIVGGTSAVSAGIEDDLVEEVGVVNTQRISGGSAAGTSVEVAKVMLGDCADVLDTNKDLVALVNRDAIADGIASAPVLGRGHKGSNPVPVLLVGDELPAAVEQYLKGTLNVRGTQKTHLSILAIGGTAVVSGGVTDTAKGVMDAATAAAKTSGEITATIEAQKYSVADALAGDIPTGKKIGDYKNAFTVKFSDPVADAAVEDPTLYRVNTRSLEALADDEQNNEESLAANYRIDVATGIVTVTLVHALNAGDKITVVGGSRVGTNGDRRPLTGASVTLDAVTTATDRAAPRIEIISVAGTANFDVIVKESDIRHNELVLANDFAKFIEVRGASVPARTNNAGTPDDTSDDTRIERLDRDVTITAAGDPQTAVGRSSSTGWVRLRFAVSVAAKATSPNQDTPAQVLIPGDVITVKRNAVLDAGRSNALERHTVQKLKAEGKFEITSVSIGNVRHGELDGTGHASATIGDDMVVTAKADGGAAGAQGNDWKIYGFDDRPNGDLNVYEWDIRVGVDVANKVISYTIFSKPAVPGYEKVAKAAPNIGNLADKLAANDDFAAHFGLHFITPRPDPDLGRGQEIGPTAAAGVPFTGGLSSVGVIVKFNDNVVSMTNDATNSGLTAVNAAGGTSLAEDIAPKFSTTDEASAAPDRLVVTFVPPDNQVHISYTADKMSQLPTRAGFRVIGAGVATGNPDGTVTPAGDAQTNIREILNSLRPDASIRP